ncbi:6-phospho-3-hexuloisomerase [Candidatus Beckwithbacteria bacterium CG10_big_fil_rev_8_21_14_0_10_34_10]|uniref:6-phospho-3-hexuloisomerase n=1 Tax=Candidatus Beckwithbacteria bacterium CG10_big_fil_rev_8_21_14_0_10_34_10 TaxID=1974495 RepID=A0A2H0WAB2_9BACT|nr:MAG: 6-phospho-3-hexuloisomerase [Candidatus Beckwithbacteria bacterium CG10_big_fil_rev_8_21_14_0_10_34_10]
MIFTSILREINQVTKKIDEKEIRNFIKEIKKAKRIFVVGVGRSGLMVKNLALRLVRLKKKTFVIGETINPEVKKNDLLIAVSGSGETEAVLSAVKICRVKGARILGVLADKNSPLAKLSHCFVLVPAKIPKRLGNQYQLRELIGVPERSPTKSLFEVCSLIFFETAVDKLNGKE